jgi:hypothetical protein
VSEPRAAYIPVLYSLLTFFSHLDLVELGAWSPGLLSTLAKWILLPSMTHSLTSTTW